MNDTPSQDVPDVIPADQVSDLTPWIGVLLPVGLMLGLMLIALVDPARCAAMMSKEEGFIEHLTVIILIPGIMAGGWAWWRRKSMPTPIAGWWTLMWSLACIYFAGEEASWGQHFFGWETPDSLTALNDQQETNLHNMSAWLDQKPRAAVELFIIIAGIIIPTINVFAKQRAPKTSEVLYWVWGTQATIFAAVMLPVARAFEPLYEWTNSKNLEGLASSELREQFIAMFLSLYLMSNAWRLWSIRRIRRDLDGGTKENRTAQ